MICCIVRFLPPLVSVATNSQQLLLATIRNNYRSSLLGGRGPTAESLAPTLMGMGDGELFVLKLILRTFGAALLLCVPRLLWLVVGHAGLKDKSSAPARLLDTGV